MLITGVLVFLYGYYVWRGLIGIPIELPGKVTLDGELRKVRPWAPWWIMPSVTAVIGMLLWRLLAQRAHRISFRGAASAYVLTAISAFIVVTFCLELGAIAQYMPRPPLMKIVAVLPLIASEALAISLINMQYHGIVIVPGAALLGLAVAGLTRLALSLTSSAVANIVSVVAITGAVAVTVYAMSRIERIDRSPPGSFADTVERNRTGDPRARAPAPVLGPEPWAAAEQNAKGVRDGAREGALRALAQPADGLCEKVANQRLMGGIGYYLEQRGMQERGYPASWSAPRRRYIAEVWGTPDDKQIERRMRELYQAGYLDLERFKSKGEIVQRLLGDLKPSGKAC